MLPRSFRYYGKKRGHRRTGSSQLGSVGEAVFWAALLLLGCAGAALLVLNFVLPEWRVNHEFIETTCKVLDKRIGEKASKDGPLYRPDIKIEYEVGGVRYSDWHYDIHRSYFNDRSTAQAILDRLDVSSKSGQPLPCWYDPRNPRVVVLERGYRWWVWLAFTVPISFVAIGAGGLIYTLLRWGKSAEHRAAMTQRNQDRDFFGSATGDGQPLYPFVPSGADAANSPGTKLRFRLPLARSPGWALFGTLAFALIWNGVVWWYAVNAILGHMAGQPDWFLTLFVVPFVLIGVGTIVFFLRQLLVATSIGPTLVEISDHPLHCGGQYRLFLSQSGRLKVNTMRISLTCEETATYRQGTNTRIEAQEVYRQELFDRQNFEIQSGLPFETELDFSAPQRAMHSFKAAHNEINWALVVEGDVAGWRPSYKRRFPLVVRPAREDLL